MGFINFIILNERRAKLNLVCPAFFFLLFVCFLIISFLYKLILMDWGLYKTPPESQNLPLKKNPFKTQNVVPITRNMATRFSVP
ncbi:MAG: hypothetical protein COU27_00855 [Candidatus Levybacteria bacterium CG10_big_fil_rev_8_21_14_0_10_36_7]|nr:MAG: hypothetical protein COU27_00855 [Candidatus Levybacteria bacterium CG10_big_fil_rev_8_21_14_0_10_36_7]